MQPAVPPQDGIGRDNRGHLHKSPATAAVVGVTIPIFTYV